MIKVLLVDDHKIIRDGIKSLLEDENDLQIIGECENGSFVRDFIMNNEVDVILMDISMSVKGGIETTEELTKEFPGIKIIALSMHDQEAFISRMLKAGASGYALKTTGKEELKQAITNVHNGQTHFSQEVTEIMMSKYLKKNLKTFNDPINVSLEHLTEREKEILRLIASEITNQEIAEKLFISSRTVDSHRRNLLQKTGARNTAGLTNFAIMHDLI